MRFTGPPVIALGGLVTIQCNEGTPLIVPKDDPASEKGTFFETTCVFECDNFFGGSVGHLVMVFIEAIARELASYVRTRRLLSHYTEHR